MAIDWWLSCVAVVAADWRRLSTDDDDDRMNCVDYVNDYDDWLVDDDDDGGDDDVDAVSDANDLEVICARM